MHNLLCLVLACLTLQLSGQPVPETWVGVRLIGRRANQLFLLASSHGIAKARGARWCVHNMQDSLVLDLVALHPSPSECPSGTRFRAVSEQGRFQHYVPEMLSTPGNIEVGDYLQSWRYFQGLPFSLLHAEWARGWVASQRVEVGIHVRRGDMVASTMYNVAPAKYFANAIERLRALTQRQDLRFVVCTDDVAWVRAQPVFEGMLVTEDTTPNEDFAILAACKHVITSVGTFGWWAAYLKLDREGHVFYYDKPFKTESSHAMDVGHNPVDHFPPSWIPVPLELALGICTNPTRRTPNADSAIVTMLTDQVEAYGLGALKLIASIQGRADAANTDFILLELVERPLPAEIRETLVYGGWKLCAVHRIPAREPVHPRFVDQFTKLVVWNMVEYTRIVYLDSDCLVTGTLRPLLERNLSGNPIWVAKDISAGKWCPGFNMGVFVIQPSAEEFARLMRLKESGLQYDTMMSEQGFLNAVYKDAWGDIGFVNNANLAAYVQDRPTWDAAGQHNVIHYTMWKPFHGDNPEYAAPIALWNSVSLYPSRGRKRCPVTFVTQYFEIPSKNPPEYYSRWMQNILRTDMCLVIFSDDAARFQSEDSKRVVVQVNLEAEARIFNQTPAFWQAQFERDSERRLHQGYKLYWVWNLKTVFLKRMVEQNPFASTYFFWIDIGCVRGDGTAERQFRWSSFWPPKDVMLHHKIFVSNPVPFDQGETGDSSFEHLARLAGAIWGGHAEAVQRWSDAYMTVFADYVAGGRFVGKDQNMMAAACLRWRDLCQLVAPSPSDGDPWFSMLPFLRRGAA